MKQKSLPKSNNPSFLLHKSQTKNKPHLHTLPCILKSKSKDNKLNFPRIAILNKKSKSFSTTKKIKYIFNRSNMPSRSKSNQSKSLRKKILTQPIITLKSQYENAVIKVFKILDIFSRGYISQANLNKWVPEEALYFLGSVFQKIRAMRMSMNINQFKNQCLKIFEKSNEVDIKQFIHNINKHNNLDEQKISLQEHQKQTVQSQVQDRLTFTCDTQTSFRKISHRGQILPLTTIESSSVPQCSEQNLILCQKIETKSSIKLKTEKFNLSPLEHINQFENVAANINPNRKAAQIQRYPLKQTDKQTNNFNRPTFGKAQCQSPFFKGQVADLIVRTSIGNRREKLSSDRLDKLSMRLQNYIKQNAERLERSKNARFEL